MTDFRRTSSNTTMNLPLIWIMLLTSKIIINQTTKKANQIPPSTTLSSSLKINDNDPLHHELLNAPKAKTIILFTPPLAEGEHNHETQITQSEQTAEYICTSGINGPKLMYGTVRSASRQPELHCYYTTVNESNGDITYPHGEDTEGGVIKECYASPVLAEKVEPPERDTTMTTATKRLKNGPEATMCHQGDDTVGVATGKYAAPSIKRPIEPPERVCHRQELEGSIRRTTPNQAIKMAHFDTLSPAPRAPSSSKEKRVAGASSHVLVSEAPGWYLIMEVDERGGQTCPTSLKLPGKPRNVHLQRPQTHPDKQMILPEQTSSL